MVISSPCLIDNKELTSPEQTAPGKDFSNPLIVDSLLKTIWSSMHHVFTMKHWLVQSKRLLNLVLGQCIINTASRKEVSTADGPKMLIGDNDSWRLLAGCLYLIL
ncbi:hypothetical protein Tco_0554379 [Tanacetum coccineum]